uniref:8.9 kDa family member n=1 Tax=Rhipicephalus zambeziensis TaxID=60191 RepID=A0A224Y149_9ACAR
MASWMRLTTATQSVIIFLLLIQAECIPHEAEGWCPVMQTGRKCIFFGHIIPRGQSRALRKPCVLVSCTDDAVALIVSGCSTQGRVSPTRPKGCGGFADAWPRCCESCRRPRRSGSPRRRNVGE